MAVTQHRRKSFTEVLEIMVWTPSEIANMIISLTDKSFCGIVEIKIYNGQIVRCEKRTVEVIAPLTRCPDEGTQGGSNT